MKSIFLAILLICSVVSGGCRRRDQASEEKTEEERGKRMIQVQNIKVDEETLMLDYRVSNPFRSAIWVCTDSNEDIDDDTCDVETKVISNRLQIRLHFNNLPSFSAFGPDYFAKYRRLSPGESHAGNIRLKLPVRNASPLGNPPEEKGTKHRQILSARVAFGMGYFETTEIDRAFARQKEWKSRLQNAGSTILSNVPFEREEIVDGKSCQFAIVPRHWIGQKNEKYATVIITDAEVPCLIEVEK